MTHPSVRLKGTENNYEPVHCLNSKCTNLSTHMHCPFCVKTESFIDPVILKAHYRVKHVDKGIEFAGLKVLRCCDHCDIVGTIKGTKEFKGAHWHCYRCKNGFNRRDEAIKHYRTHFRNPQTTFQIQVTQDVDQHLYQSNCEVSVDEDKHHDESSEDIDQHDATFHKLNEGEVHVAVAANETVAAEGQTIMIIQSSGDHLDAEDVQTAIRNGTVHVANLEKSKPIDEERSNLERRLVQMQDRLVKAESEHANTEKKLIDEIHFLKDQMQSQAAQILNLQKREQQLLTQLSIPLDDYIQDMLVKLKTEHENLLHQQLSQLRRSYIQQLGHTSLSIGNEKVENNAIASNIVFMQATDAGTLEITDENAERSIGDNSVSQHQIIVMPSATQSALSRSVKSVSESNRNKCQQDTHQQVIISTSAGDFDNSPITRLTDATLNSNEIVMISDQGEDTVCHVEDIEEHENETILQVRLVPQSLMDDEQHSHEEQTLVTDYGEMDEPSPLKKRKRHED